MISKKVYLREVLEQTPRLLGLINRNPCSKSYGCFDRQYWHYNTTDFPCAEYQESVLTLAYLYSLDDKENPYYNNCSVIEWINAGINFWCRIQNKNGSFSEWYPNENSMSVTPFATYAISEALLLLKDKIIEREMVIACLEKAGKWLMHNKDMRATNHYSGSTIALYKLFMITEKPEYKYSAQNIVSELLKIQDDEGWFPEYNGADVGYTSVTIYYLSRYYQHAKDNKVLQMISKAVEFTFYFIHSDGTFGGEYGSRNTEYIIPDGFEIMAQYLPKAAIIASKIRLSLTQKKHVAPSCFDDRYLCYLSYMYIQAYVDASDISIEESLPFNKDFIKVFPNAGLKIISNPWCYCVQNIKKGGALKLDFKKSQHSFMDAGVIVEDKQKRGFYSFYLNSDNGVESAGAYLKTYRSLSRIPQNILTPLSNIIQRIFSMSIGKVNWIEKWLKECLRNLLITNIKLSSFTHTREVIIFEDGLFIKDKIDKIANINRLIVGAKSSYVYGPSTRFFQPSGLNQVAISYDREKLETYDSMDNVTIIRKFDNEGNLFSVKIKAQ